MAKNRKPIKINDDGTATICLGRGFFCIIDAEDVCAVSKYGWTAKDTDPNRIYAHAHTKNTSILLHRIIMSVDKNKQVDHINGNTLDNRRANLRICTAAQNSANRKKETKRQLTSKYKGVYFRTDSKKYRASIRVNKKLISLGSFKTEKEAALAYNKAALKFFGVFAKLNNL